MNLVIETIKKRRSIRGFRPQQIKDSELEVILDCAVNAPSACNMQSWHFTVIQNAEVIKYLQYTAKQFLKLEENMTFRKFGEDEDIDLIYGAPTLIIVSGKEDAVDPLIDCSAATQNMLLCAQSIGIGTLWNGLIDYAFKDEAARIKIGISEKYVTYYGVALGYAKKNVELMKKEIIREGVVNYIR